MARNTLQPTSIVLPRELKAELKKEADAKKWGLSMLIREIPPELAGDDEEKGNPAMSSKIDEAMLRTYRARLEATTSWEEYKKVHLEWVDMLITNEIAKVTNYKWVDDLSVDFDK